MIGQNPHEASPDGQPPAPDVADAAPTPAPAATEVPDAASPPTEYGGREGPDPVRYGDWEKNGRCIDF